jgi:N-terminal domain of NWD NACHT-NTPase
MRYTCADAFGKRKFEGRGEIPTVHGVDAGDREVQLQKLVDQKLQDMQNSRLKITVGGKEVVVKEQVRTIVHAILSAKDFIGSAVSAEPHAALAWAGVLVVLPVRIIISITFLLGS